VEELVISEGPGAGERIEVDGELVLGRAGDFGAEDEELSRRHAVLRAGSDGLEVEDLGSLNGTFVNGRKIDRTTQLHGGDLVRVGRTVLKVEGTSAHVGTVVSRVPAEAESGREGAPSREPVAVFGTYAAPEFPRRRGRVASRKLTPTILSFAAIIGTAVALIAYFAQH
jgi:hypothetical protein